MRGRGQHRFKLPVAFHVGNVQKYRGKILKSRLISPDICLSDYSHQLSDYGYQFNKLIMTKRNTALVVGAGGVIGSNLIGDVFRWNELWPKIAQYFKMDTGVWVFTSSWIRKRCFTGCLMSCGGAGLFHNVIAL